MTDGETVLASVNQVPLRCAWGITIHKSQGMTLDAAVMDLRRTFAPGMGYVALSRVENLESIYLEGINDRAFSVSADAVLLDSVLRQSSQHASEMLAKDGAVAFVKNNNEDDYAKIQELDVFANNHKDDAVNANADDAVNDEKDDAVNDEFVFNDEF